MVVKINQAVEVGYELFAKKAMALFSQVPQDQALRLNDSLKTNNNRLKLLLYYTKIFKKYPKM